MQHLIPMTRTEIGTSTAPTVNARDLYQFLEVQTRFNDWIERRIEEYDFEEDKDFCYSYLSSKTKGSGGHNRKNDLCLILPNGGIKKHDEDHRHLDGGQRHGR